MSETVAHKNPCPECGGVKLRRATRCKACHAAHMRGRERTASPSNSAGWHRARMRFSLGVCSYPGCAAAAIDHHHVDGNPTNNASENVTTYCRRHHMMVDGRLAAVADRAPEAGKLGGRPRKVAE